MLSTKFCILYVLYKIIRTIKQYKVALAGRDSNHVHDFLLREFSFYGYDSSLKVDTRRKFTTSANYGQIIYGWKDFPLIYTNNVLRIHINLLEIRKM